LGDSGDVGNVISGQSDVHKDVVRHFKSLFLEDHPPPIYEELKLLHLFPSFFDDEEGKDIARPIVLEEVKLVIEGFSKEVIYTILSASPLH
jgi:hypothetical protein